MDWSRRRSHRIDVESGLEPAALNDGLAGLGQRAQDIRTQNNIAVVRKKHTPIDYVAILPLGIEASNTNRKMGIR